ncbi:hypothetical protein Tco_0858523 [Tanacetum coccineum]|uniref:Retrovirus-related Pol polyprotein from transposon TNT 1-94 n=1 Tax=Tanacetum coccineum TaxID=301880 RepID=A0ABQ5B9C5_9ASTR
MTLSSLEEVNYFKLRKPNLQMLLELKLPPRVYIHNHKDYLGKFDEKADDGYIVCYLLISKAFRFSKPSVEDITIVESERYPPDEYLHHFEPSQSFNSKTPTTTPSLTTPPPQVKWSRDKHIKLVKIMGNPRAGMLTGVMAKELSVASAHECLFVDYVFEEEPKKVSESLKHPGWVDSIQEELN